MIIGVDLGGTKILTGLADRKGKLIATVKLDTQAELGPKKVINNVFRSISLLLEKTKTPLSRISKIGIGAPGPVIEEAVVVSPPNMPGWRKVNLKKILQDKFKKPVIVENDANAAALAEYYFGAGKGSNNMVYMTISTGIGGGLIINGKLYRGSIGTAGEVGHMIIDSKGPKCGCGNYGCLEALASGTAIARIAGQPNALKTELAAKSGDKRSANAIKMGAMYLGMGIANLNNILNPDIVVLGGGVINMGNMIIRPVREWTKKCSMISPGKHLKIVAAKLKNNVGVMGAIALCLEGSPDVARRAKSGDD